MFVSARAINPYENVSVFTSIWAVDCLESLHPRPVMIKLKTLLGASDLIISWDVSAHFRELASMPSLSLSSLKIKNEI